MAETLTSEMLKSKRRWEKISATIEAIMREKEKKERKIKSREECTEPET